MSKHFLLLIALVFLSHLAQTVYFENQGCIEKTSDGFQCKTCGQGFTLDQGICKVTDFSHTVKSDHPYSRVYAGQEILAAASYDLTLNKIIKAVKDHPLYQPLITMVKEQSQVAYRTNYRVMCENNHSKIDFFVYYFHKTDSVAIVGVNSTTIGSTVTGSARLLAIAGNRFTEVVKISKDQKVSKWEKNQAKSEGKKGKSCLKKNPPKSDFSNSLPVRQKRPVKTLDDECVKILKHKNMVQTKIMTHKWSKHRHEWEQQIGVLNNKHVECVKNSPVPLPAPIVNAPIPIPSPNVFQNDVGKPSNVTDYTNSSDQSGSTIVNQDDVYKTVNNLSPDNFTDDVKMVVQLFSLQQQYNLSNHIIFIEFRSDGDVDQYAVTARFRSNDTVRYYALRIVASNEFLFMGKQYYPANFDPTLDANKFLQAIAPVGYSVDNNDLFTNLSQFITANNNTHFDVTKLEVAQRVYPNGSYFLTSVHIDYDVDAVSKVVRLNRANFMNIKYQETKLPSSPIIGMPAPVPLPDTNTTDPAVNTTSGCCSTLEQKQDACVDYLKKFYQPNPELSQASLMYTENQVLPNGVSFDFYLEYSDALVTVGYTATVARYNDGSFSILMFDKV